MNRSDVQAWLDRYITAWRSGEADDIGELFSDDAAYRYRPYDDDEAAPRGRDAIVAAWQDEQDDPAGWEAGYLAWAVDGDRAVATGFSRYAATADEPEKTYHNVFLLRFDEEGRCREFTEYFMLEKPREG